MKLIIDIPDEAYNVLLTEQVLPPHIDVEWLLIHGIPLDDVKAKIVALPNANPSYWHSGDMVEREEVLDILDNIGKDKGGE